MAIVSCQTIVDSSGRELLSHGTRDYPVSCCNDDLGANYVPWHWHEELEAVWVERGSATVAAGEEKFTVSAGEGFFINSSVLHACWDSENSSCRFHSIVFDTSLVGGAEHSVFYEKYVNALVNSRALPYVILKPDTPWQAQALSCIEQAWQANSLELPFYEIETRSQLSKLIALLGQNCSDEGQSGDWRTLRQSERMKLMLQFIRDNVEDKITVAQIAASANISESECLRCFRDSIQTTPIQYLRTYRIRRAAELLRSSEEKISVIAQICGFEDVSYFTKIFRQLKGCTPSRYRDNI